MMVASKIKRLNYVIVTSNTSL